MSPSFTQSRFFYSIVYFFLECHDRHPSEGTVIISLDQVSLQAGFQLES